MAKKKKKGRPVKPSIPPLPKDFLDMIAPAAVKFNTDSYILGGAYHCTLALRGYPTATEELALLRHLGEKSGVTLHIYLRQVTAAEENAILHNATNKNRMERGNSNDMKQSITAEANLQDVATLITTMHRNREPLIHCAVFIELSARDADGLRSLRDDVTAELTRSKLNADRILLRQREGFLASNPAGSNVFGPLYERVLPASSVANLFFFNYSGKNDPNGFYIGKDRYGSNIIVDLDRRAEDKTNASVLILGNSGQGKSFLLKLLLCNIRESGKSAICLDPEHELVDLCANLGGCFADLMSGQYIINPLEPKLWDAEGEDDPEAPPAFRQRTRLSQHISFLKDFFRAYKDFSDRHIDTIELMLERLYKKWGLNNHTNFQSMRPEDFPILSDLYDVIEDAYESCENYKGREYHNAVFVGKDENGVARHAHKRSLNSLGKSFRINVEGSDPRCSFHYTGTSDRLYVFVEGSDPRCSFHYTGTSDRLYVFEAPIDLLSFLTRYPRGWQEHSFVSLCGTSEHAMLWMLEQNPNLYTICLCLDHDAAGIEASGRLTEILHEHNYDRVGVIQSEYKDWNEDLKARHGLPAQEAEEHPQLIAAPEVCGRIGVYMRECTVPERLGRELADALRRYEMNTRAGCMDSAMDCIELASALALYAYGRELRQMGITHSGEELVEDLCNRILPHQNRGSLKSRTAELVEQTRRVCEKASAPGLRSEAEKRELAESWLELTVSCAKVSVKYEADNLKQQQKQKQAVAMNMEVM